MKKFFVLLVLSLAALGQLGCQKAGAPGNQSRRTPASHSATVTQVAAADLIEAYRRSESAADTQYKGKTLAVSGTVARAGKDYMNRLYVNLKGDNPIIEVHCTYDEAEREAMSALKEGQQVTIRGVCDGKVSTHIILKDSVPE